MNIRIKNWVNRTKTKYRTVDEVREFLEDKYKKGKEEGCSLVMRKKGKYRVFHPVTVKIIAGQIDKELSIENKVAEYTIHKDKITKKEDNITTRILIDNFTDDVRRVRIPQYFIKSLDNLIKD